MKPVTVINRISVKPGRMDEFIEAQQKFSPGLLSRGLVGGRMYRSVDGQSAVLVSTFESKEAQEQILQSSGFKEHLKRLQTLVESSNPTVFEEAYSTGAFK